MLEILFYLFLFAIVIILAICLLVWGFCQILKRLLHPGSSMDRQSRPNELMNGSKIPSDTFGNMKFHDDDDDDD